MKCRSAKAWSSPWWRCPAPAKGEGEQGAVRVLSVAAARAMQRMGFGVGGGNCKQSLVRVNYPGRSVKVINANQKQQFHLFGDYSISRFDVDRLR